MVAKKLKDKWESRTVILLEKARGEESPEQLLMFLGTIIRSLETTANRATYIVGRLKEQAKETLEALGVDEFRISQRNFMRLDRTSKIPDGEIGQTKYDELVKRFGQGFVDGVVKRVKTSVPATIKITFELNEAVYEKLDQAQKKIWAQVIGKDRVVVTDPPKRARQGKPRQKRRIKK